MKNLTDKDTFNAATSQEVFDFIAHHLLTQNEKSIRGYGCKYRSQRNLKCAAGCLISGKSYHRGFEHHTWDYVSKVLGMTNHEDLVMDLQRIHDNYSPREWVYELNFLAKLLNLSTSVLKEFE